MNEANMLDVSVNGTAIENLYPALTECFAIIVCGYAAGRLNLISETEARGINSFIATFSLPSLIFMSLAELDLNQVNWLFLSSILIAKSLVFFSVIVITLLVGRRKKLATAGIYAIFCTQSNDFAIGYPIVAALYNTIHPEYAKYLYLMAPISLAILNPIAFVLMEISERQRTFSEGDELLIYDGEIPNTPNRYGEKCKLAVRVAKNIFLNPVILMTILGVLGNLIFKHKVPIYLGGTLQVLGSAFSASALFLLGLRMVGKMHKLVGTALVVPGILIMVKLIALPLVIREVISSLHPGYNESETVDLSTYGFLYGTFPSAPGVFVFATQYNTNVDLIASAMVVCTFISAPLMFVSAKMITLTNCSPSDYIKQLDAFILDISILSLIACIWVIVVFILTKKIFKIPHKITSCLILSQLLGCLGAILWNTLDQKQGWMGYIQFTLFTIGVYSTRIWTMILAVTLLFLQCRSLCYVLKLQPLFFLVGWGLPLVLAALLMIFDHQTRAPFKETNPNFIYGSPQAIIAVSLLVLCFIVTVGCLILHQRYVRSLNRYANLVSDISSDQGQSQSTPDLDAQIQTEVESTSDNVHSLPTKPSTSSEDLQNSQKCCGLPTITEGCCEEKESPVVDIEDILNETQSNSLPILKSHVITGNGNIANHHESICSSSFGCAGLTREACRGIERQYQQQIDEDLELIEEEPDSHDPQILRHIILLIMLLGSMFVGLSLSIWTLVMEQMSGIYIELSFLDASLNFGQSIMVFAIFGLNIKEISLPIVKCWRKMWYGANTLSLPSWHELSMETKHICDQFVTHHLQNCRSTIAKDKRWRLKVYKNVFSGEKLVDWLIEVGLARDRIEAVNYGRYLVEGKVLKHINGVYHFYDRSLLYCFV